MTTTTTGALGTANTTRSLRLRYALGSLAALQGIHLLDSLRTNSEATIAGELLTPQAILGIGGALLALVLEARRSRRARPLAIVVASLVTLGFLLSHGLPFESERTEPYWGDGSADLGQWVGVTAVLAAAAVTIVLARALVRSERAALEL